MGGNSSPVRTPEGYRRPDTGSAGGSPDVLIVDWETQQLSDAPAEGVVFDNSVTDRTFTIAGFNFDATATITLENVPGFVAATPASLVVGAITPPAGNVPGTVALTLTGIIAQSVGTYVVRVQNAAGEVGCVGVRIVPQA